MLHLSLSSLLLAATWSLMTTDVSSERVVSCAGGGAVQRLSCDSGVVGVQDALYGRTDGQTCSEGRPPQELLNTACSLPGTFDLLRTRCDGKRFCELNLDDVRTSDPCDGTFKYLETNYTCLPAVHLNICENSEADLKCEDGQVLFVYGADYGRRDRTTCSYRRTEANLQDVLCSSPTRTVADSCNGRSSCRIRAVNSVFGDPCVGTVKYLEVSYTCQYPV